MKQSRKIYDRAFKEAVQLSYERHNISELAQLGITAPSCISGVKSTKSLDKEVFQVMAIANSWTGTNSRSWKETQGCRIRTYIKKWHLFKTVDDLCFH
jgi:hypothetical protein